MEHASFWRSPHVRRARKAVAITASSILLCWIAVQAREANRQARLVDSACRHYEIRCGREPHLSVGFDDIATGPPDSSPRFAPIPALRRAVAAALSWWDAGRYFAANVTYIDLLGADDRELEMLAGLKTLRWIEIAPPATEAAILQFNTHPCLESVNISVEMADGGLAALASLPRLRQLNVSRTLLPEEAMANLGKLYHLEELGIERCTFDPNHMRSFEALTKLRSLSLSDSTMSDVGLPHIARLRQLQFLGLFNTRVSDEGLKHVASLVNLTCLDLRETKVTDSGMQRLSSLTLLREICIEGAVSDQGVRHLVRLPHLESLELYKTQVTDSTLDELRHLPTLRSLDVRATRVTREGVIRFRQDRPMVEVLSDFQSL